MRQSIPREGAREHVVSRCVSSIMKAVVQKAKARNRARAWKNANPTRKKSNDDAYYQKKLNGHQPKQVAPYNAAARNKERRRTDQKFLVVSRLRTRLGEFMRLKNGTKADGTVNLIGCSQDALAARLKTEQEHRGVDKYAIDHIFPMEMQDIESLDGQKRAMHFSNLQVLTPHENVNKGDKLPTKAMAAKVERWAWPPGITEDMLPDIYDGWATPLRMHAD
mgnify:CR=1 FL=1